MLNLLFICGQVVSLGLCLYGAYLVIRHGDILVRARVGRIGPMGLESSASGRGRRR